MTQPYRLTIPHEIQNLAIGDNVKLYGQFKGNDIPLSYHFHDRGFEFICETSSGISTSLVVNEWYRIMGTVSDKLDQSVKISITFEPLHANCFDPDVFEKSLRIRREFEEQFDKRIVHYGNPDINVK